MTTRGDVASALTALRAFGTSEGESIGGSKEPAAVADGRAALVSAKDAPTAATIARVGSVYALLSLPRGPDGVVAARALLESALLPMADDFAVAPKQRAAARTAFVAAALALEQLAKGQAVRVRPVVFDIHPRVEARAAELRADGLAISPDVFGDEISEDVQTLNELQSLVIRWGTEIDRVVGAAREGPGMLLPADEEQLFWISVDSAFESAQKALAEPAASISLQLLARKRRLVAFQSESGDALSLGRQRAQGILNLVQSLPINPIRTADDIPTLTTAVRSLLAHVTSRLRLSSFPLNRALTLVSSVSQDVNVALCKLLLRRGGLLGQPYKACCSTAEECEELFCAWDRGFEACRLSAVERAEARGESITARPKPAFTSLQTRVRDVTNFRSEHEILVAVVKDCLAGSGHSFDIDEGVAQRASSAYVAVLETMEGSAATDVSCEGEAAWNDTYGAYTSTVQPIEDELSSAWDAAMSAIDSLEEKAAVGVIFSSIIDRPAFASVVQTRMSSLTESARSIIGSIRRKAATLVQSSGGFQEDSMLTDFTSSRGLAPVAARVLSLRQLSNTVHLVLAQVGEIVGRVRMDIDLDLRDLSNECDALHKMLDPDPIVFTWRDGLTPLIQESAGGLFLVRDTNNLQLSLSSKTMAVPREAAALKDLGFTEFGNEVAVFSQRIIGLRPVYAQLSEALHAYKVGAQSMCRLQTDWPETYARLRRLVQKQKTIVHRLFEKGSTILWTAEHPFLMSYSARLRRECRTFCECVLLASERDRQIYDSFAALERLVPRISFAGVISDGGLDAIQKQLHRVWMAVKEMKGKKAIRNVSAWYMKEHVSPPLMRVMTCVIARSVNDWICRFQCGDLEIPAMFLSYSPESRKMCLTPHVDNLEHQIYSGLVAGVSAMCRHFDLEIAREAKSWKFSAKPLCLTDCSGNDRKLKAVIRKAGACIHQEVLKAKATVEDWRRFEGLWNITDVSSSANDCEDENVLSFTSLLDQVEETRSELCAKQGELDNLSQCPVPLNYSDALDSIFSVLAGFSDALSRRCATVLASESQSVYSLASESMSLLRDSAVGDPMNSLLVLEGIDKTVLPTCDEKLKQLTRLQDVVCKLSKYSPAEDSVDMEALASAVSSLRTEFERRQRHVDADRPALEARYDSEAGALELELATLFGDVSKHKDETVESEDANAVLKDLTVMDERLLNLSSSCERLRCVSVALSLPELSNDMELETLAAELKEMRLSMTEVSACAAEYAAFGRTRVGDVDSKATRQGLEKLIDRLRELQESRGSLSAACKLDADLRSSLRVHSHISSLRCAKLSSPRERELVEKLLGSDASEIGLYNATLQDLWSCDLSKHDKYLRGVFESAAGESALAAFLAKVADTWTSRRVEFVQRGRVYLIRGIPVLVDDANEHIQALCAMSGSSHARLFESERASWEFRIAKFRDEVEVWAEVQTKWLHLSSLFGESSPSSSTLRLQLRDEYASFMSVQSRLSEFSLRAKAASGVLEVLEKQSGLNRMSVELSAIVRGLGKFLESQRSLFPRFFYLSDDDLLSMLSVSRENLSDVTPHLSKLFPGVSYLVGSDDDKRSRTTVTQVVSKEGEVLTLCASVFISSQTHIVSWLRELETKIEQTLRAALPPLISSIAIIMYASCDTEKSSTATLTNLLRYAPAQLIILASKIAFTESVEKVLSQSNFDSARGNLAAAIQRSLQLAAEVEYDEPSLDKKSASRFRTIREQVIKELVYQRGVLQSFGSTTYSVEKDRMYAWYSQLRFYVKELGDERKFSVEVRMADAVVSCGWEYLGVGETLVQTPLTCRCFLTLMQALKRGLGGSPFGPAGTGKTESVKALGRFLGRPVAVFNCDEGFDAVSVGRILAGVCRTGSWVCFDEFNRLSAGILSSTSNQLAGLQSAIASGAKSISNFYGGLEKIRIENGVAVFVTMNPTYSGRRELPGNLTTLFRPMAMTRPDSVIIAEVSLLAQGFASAFTLSAKLVGCFGGFLELLPDRPHYDFGLRSLKSAIKAAGQLRQAPQNPDSVLDVARVEEGSMIQALIETVKPRITPDDVNLFERQMKLTFPDAILSTASMPAAVMAALEVEAKESHVVLDRALLEKISQLSKILEYRPGVILVGPTGSSKSLAWRLLFKAMFRSANASSSDSSGGTLGAKAGSESQSKGSSVRVIDPKLMTSAQLYGSLDATTREWTDGIFTAAVRDISTGGKEHIYNEGVKADGATSGLYHWLVFDGEVDPDWAENLNSVLDDSRVLTLPTGERIAFPENARVVFETESLDYANPSTISRCGMVCFASRSSLNAASVRLVKSLASEGGLYEFCLHAVEKVVPVVTSFVENVGKLGSPVMHVSNIGILYAIFALFKSALVRRSLAGKEHGEEDQAQDNMQGQDLKSNTEFSRINRDFALRSFLVASASALAGSLSGNEKALLSRKLIAEASALEDVGHEIYSLPDGCSLCDVYVDSDSGSYVSYAMELQSQCPTELNPLRVGDPDVVVPTATTLRNSATLAEFIRAGSDSMVLLCGPPGCGKSMVIGDALSSMANIELASMSFSSTTEPSDILATLRTHSSIQKLPNGDLCLRPNTPGSRTVLFCDEVNLGAPDRYGTQTAACFLRQLLEHGGYWSASHSSWIRVEGLQIVAACNPPELAGRQSLPCRLLRHTHIMRVEAPAGDDLKTIFGTLNASLLRAVDINFEDRASAVTDAMIEVYQANHDRFSPCGSGPLQPHYVYSPRDLSRWLRGIRHILLERGVIGDGTEGAAGSEEPSRYQGTMFAPRQFGETEVTSCKELSWSDVLSSLVHEARRLFIDRLMLDEEHKYAEEVLRAVLAKHLGYQKSSLPDQWYSAWPKRHHRRHGNSQNDTAGAYQPVRDVNSLRKLVYRKLRAFCEEEGLGGAWMSGSGASEGGCSMIDQFAVTDDVLRHLTRIERVLRLPLGHAVLIGAPGSGKKTLARFAAWMGGLSVHQVRSHAGYTAEHFADDLRGVLNIAGVSGKSVMMIFDESNALKGEFLEMMNAILACGEVPGLFEGEARILLLSNLRKQNLGTTGSSTDEALYKTFIKRVRANLHVLFTLSCDAKAISRGHGDKVVSIGKELLTRSPALYNRCVVDWMGDWDGNTLETVADLKLEVLRGSERDAIVKASVEIHRVASDALAGCEGAARFTTPRHFLEFVEQLNRITLEKAGEIQGGALRLKSGLTSLREAGATVDELKEKLRLKTTELTAKEKEANDALSAMAEEQRRAEQAKVESENLARQADGAAVAADERKADVADQLAAVEPKVAAARNAVGSIRKENLEELRAMPNPPAGVRLALQAVMMLLDTVASGGRPPPPMAWQEIRKRMRGPDLIPSIVHFDPDSIPNAVVKRLQRDILSNPDFDVKKVSYSSRAAGPLAEWTVASLEYAEVNESIAPLRAEAEELGEEQQLCMSRKVEAEEAVESLRFRIEECRQQYAGLVTEAGVVRRDIEDADGKLKTAERMIDSLGDEWDRWMSELTVYNETAEYVWGNAVLGAAFVSYAGALDVFARQSLIDEWRLILKRAQIEVQSSLSLGEYLTSSRERSTWSQKGLPMDETSVQSYAILKRSARYPLIIDPSRRIENVVQSVVLAARPAALAAKQSLVSSSDSRAAEKAIVVKTSFASTGKHSYLRIIESAMRFGTAVLVEDAEQFDNSIAPVLGQEATTGDISDGASQDSSASGNNRDTGLSHRLVRLGDRDVDQNPAFRLILSASNLAATPAAAVSRCCVVSFTFSEANLVNRCVSRALRFITPELEAKRVELASARLAYEKRKLALEECLLSAIAEASGDGTGLLEGSLLLTLQTLKSESKQIEAQMSLRKNVMEEVDSATIKFQPVAQFAVRVFFGLSKLVHMNTLYRFSADYFLGLFDSCIQSACNRCRGEEAAVLNAVFADLASTLFLAVSPTLFPEDQVPFAAVLSLVGLRDDMELKDVQESLEELAHAESFSLRSAANGGSGTASSSPVVGLVSKILSSFKNAPSEIRAAVNELACRLRRNDIAIIESSCGKSDFVLTSEIQNYAESQRSPAAKKNTFRPLLLCTRGAGVDPSALVTLHSRAAGVICESLAVGDSESVALTRSALDFASQKWGRSSSSRGLLLIKNVHLAPVECAELLRREIVRHHGRLPYLVVIAGEVGGSGSGSVNANLASLSSDCRVLAFEAPSDFRSSLKRCFSIVSSGKKPVDSETGRVMTAVSWLHAAIVERCRYAPAGISKQYDFSEADLAAARDTVVSLFGQTRANPSLDVLARLVADSVYGGRLECKADSDAINTVIEQHFARVSAHKSDVYVRVVGDDTGEGQVVELPSDPTEFTKIVDAFPVCAPARWFGLDSEAETKKESRAGIASVEILLKMYLGLNALPHSRLS